MGAFDKTRLTNAPLALALLLALASSTSSVAGPHTSDRAVRSSTQKAVADQSAASVTSVRSATPRSAAALKPAVRVAATGRMDNAITRVQVPDVLLRAYRSAAAGTPAACHLPVSLLAAIGEVESGSLVGRQLDARHRTSILGPVLDGKGFAAVPDTDGGQWDGDTKWDRAVGPMQFIPSTWRKFGVDGDGDGAADPQDVEDASAATAAYLCYGGRDLSTPTDLSAAVLAYNHSKAYERLVLTYQQRYARLGLDRGDAVVGLSMPVGLVTTESLQAVEAGPASENGTGETRSAGRRHRTHRHEAVRARSHRHTKAGGRHGGRHGGTQPTGQPSHQPAGTPSAPATAAATATATATAIVTASASPTASSTGSPTTSPTGSASATPTATASPTGAATDPVTGCPVLDPAATDPGTGTDVPTCPPCDPSSPGAVPTATPTAADVTELACEPVVGSGLTAP